MWKKEIEKRGREKWENYARTAGKEKKNTEKEESISYVNIVRSNTTMQ